MNDIATLQALINRYTSETTLADGTPLRIRPVLPQDKEDIAEGLSRLSVESRYRRFMAALSELSPERLKYLTEIDYVDHFALGALSLAHNPPLGVGIARYVRDPAKPEVAEPAVTVVDEFQRRGVGCLLLEMIMAVAVDNGVTHFRASLLADNHPMKQMFARHGARFEAEGHGLLTAEFELPRAGQPRGQLVYGLVRSACQGAVMRARRVLPYPLNT